MTIATGLAVYKTAPIVLDARGGKMGGTATCGHEAREEDTTILPRMTTVGRPVMDHAPRHRRQQTIGLTPQGGRLMEDIFANLSYTERLQSAASQPSS